MISLIEALLLTEGGVVSIVGSGGKTSLMFRLAQELVQANATVLTTTTTKIFKPDKTQSPQVIVSSDPDEIVQRCQEHLKRHPHVTAAAGTVASMRHKLTGLSPEVVDQLFDTGAFNWILVEADGAAGRPLKAPAAHEPVIPASSRWVIGLAGLKGVGQPLTEKWVFRSPLFAELTGLAPGRAVTEPSVAYALTAKQGIFKGSPPKAKRIAFLNMADRRKRLVMARRIVRELKNTSRPRKLHRVVVGKLLHPMPVIEYDTL